MKQFYFQNENEQEGPIDFQKAGLVGIKPETMIWFEGMDDWMPAKDVPEFEPILKKGTPPPLKKATPPANTKADSTQTNRTSKTAGHQTPPTQKRNSRWLFTVLVLAVVAAIVIIKFRNWGGSDSNYGGGSSYAPPPTPPRTYEEKVVDISKQEGSQPSRFLEAGGTYRPTLFGKDFKIDGEIISSATAANFKDVEIQVSYYSSTRTLLGSERITVYQYVRAGKRVNFKFRADPPRATSTLGWDVIDAVYVR